MNETGLPEVGDVFMTGTLIFNNGDHAIERPVVVVRAPRHKHDYVTVIQRSSTPKDQKGVDHPRDDTLGLNKEGRWILNYQRAVRCDELLIVADYRGRLPHAYLHPLVDMWEQA